MYQKAIFLFTNDLRIEDNTALNEAFLQSKSVIPLFIFNPVQVDSINPYRSMNALQFMIERLRGLEKEISKQRGILNFWYDYPLKVLEKIIKENQIKALFFTTDYTPFSINRAQQIEQLCIKTGISCHRYSDRLLTDPKMVIAKKGSFYKVFTSFFKKASQFPIKNPVTEKRQKWYPYSLKGAPELTNISKIILNGYNNPDLFVKGESGVKLLDMINELSDYAKTRDVPFLPTSALAAHLQFGTVSIRQAYYAIAEKLGFCHLLIKQLYWREFFLHSIFFHPQMLGHAMKSQYDNIAWTDNKEHFERWCNGTTGFPIVDAGMRQLNKTGWMHNRVRMITASFLVKDLHIDWRWGERYFATKLVDYNPAVNNGNWQWCASTGFDSQPYFRIFNPWEQQKKFDPDCIYIKKWVPELQKESAKTIHAWFLQGKQSVYSPPIVDHKVQSAQAKLLFKKAAFTNRDSGI